MSVLTRKFAEAETCEQVLEYVYEWAKYHGACWMTYHFSAPYTAQSPAFARIWARDFPDRLQEKYFGEGFRERDPIPRLAFEHGPVLTHAQASEKAGKDADPRAYFDTLDELGVSNWAVFALFGPHDRDGFASMCFSTDPDTFAKGLLAEIHSELQAAHMRIAELSASKESGVELSAREKDVLGWMVKGKSAADIAAILAISPETVRTYTRRLYDKLGTVDRVSAIIKALKLGLVVA